MSSLAGDFEDTFSHGVAHVHFMHFCGFNTDEDTEVDEETSQKEVPVRSKEPKVPVTFEPSHDKTNKMTCASIQSDESLRCACYG